MTSALRILLVSVILAGAATAQAETTFPIANTSRLEQSSGAAFDGSNFLVDVADKPWADPNNNSQTISAQLVSKTGALVGSRISTGATGGGAMIAFDGTNYLLVYEAITHDTVAGQFVNPSGALVGSQFNILTATNRMLGFPSGVIFDGANYFVVWKSNSTTDNSDTADIFGQFITPGGAKLGSVIAISTAVQKQKFPVIAYDGANILAAWTDGRNQSACYTDGAGTHCYESDIYGQLITKSGVSTAGNLSGNNFLISAGTLPRDNPINIAFGGTNYLVTFTEETTLPNACLSAGCNWEAYGILVSKAGASIGSKFVIGNATTNLKFLPAPVYLGTKYLITWTNGYGTTSASVRGQYVTTSGTLDGSEFTLFSPSSTGAVPFFGRVYTGGGVNLAVSNWGIPDPTDPTDMDIYTSTDVMGSFITLSDVDTASPSVPIGVSATAASSTQVNLSWTASTDNIGVTGYQVYRNSALVGNPAVTTYSDTGLSASISYSYTVAACDAANNCSAQSSAVAATTLSSVATLSLVSGWNL
ncbi:MAG: fibronectin type III domain-containing protein, partial [Proteobacteria bacterium]|nr:fibronectin type III domain-containing protein [Pseudomonadota bacterium]